MLADENTSITIDFAGIFLGGLKSAVFVGLRGQKRIFVLSLNN